LKAFFQRCNEHLRAVNKHSEHFLTSGECSSNLSLFLVLLGWMVSSHKTGAGNLAAILNTTLLIPLPEVID
jgi:hypothetical protein